MIRALALLALLLPCAALAQPTQSTMITPAPLTGYATLSVLAASLPLSNATSGPNAPPFPVSSLPGRYIEVKNSIASSSTLFVCPLGGTCTTAAGIPLAAGESKTLFLPASSAGTLVSPTVISGGTATAVVSW